MYSIKINGNIVKQTDKSTVAWSLYRATARLFENKPNHVQLYSDAELLHQKPSGLMLLEHPDSAAVNDILMTLIKTLDLSFPEVKSLIKDSELELSNSRIDGWFYPKDNRRFVQMYNDELEYLTPILTRYAQAKSQRANLGFTAQGLKSMRAQLGLTQQQVADIVGVAGNRQVRRCENGEQDMPSKKWQIFWIFIKKITDSDG
ncbi:hypothetical protein [Moraxella porci]|uniref:hypothetical protein n=1 Tax=Moraxella porci TaxID=1288392 RepID=UPI002448BC42|nr:hypothetical protein [Moraxella porci]MDH2272948.1 hypothetical protein [Moraxella porci]